MNVRDLLEAQPGLTLIGPAAGLDHEIRWVYTTDLLDPSPYLTGGELVLTSEGWYSSDADCFAFVDALLSSSVAALVAGDVQHGQVPAALVDACRRRGLPLLFAAREVSYGTLSEQVTRRLVDERGDALAAALTRQRRMVTLLVEGGGVDDLLAVLARQTVASCWAQSVTGRLLGAGRSDLSDLPERPERAELSRSALAAQQLPVLVEGAQRRTLYAIGRRGARSGFLVVEGDPAAWSASDRTLAATVAELLALGVARIDEQTRSLLLRHQETVSTVSGDLSGAADAVLRERGLDLRRTGVIASVTTRGDVRPWNLAVDLVDCLGAVDDPVLIAGDGEEVVALATPSDNAEQAVLRLRRVVGQLGSYLRTGRVAVGLASVAPRSGWGTALQEARRARRLAEAQPDALSLVEAGAVTSHLLLLSGTSAEARRAFRSAVLGPLEREDTRLAAELLHTLQVFLDRAGSWQRTATDLHLHVNSLRYRIARIETLLERDLSDMADRVDCYLALRC